AWFCPLWIDHQCAVRGRDARATLAAAHDVSAGFDSDVLRLPVDPAAGAEAVPRNPRHPRIRTGFAIDRDSAATCIQVAVAALVPISAYSGLARQPSLLPLMGSGRGLWGKDSRR